MRFVELNLDRLHRNPPSASRLLASMRDIGYSLDTALADLIDNSITAQADIISISCVITAETPYVAIVDNGTGMSETELIDAMKHGGSNNTRSSTDLGRFGLGLKTASFSQCRSLTVVSKKQEIMSGAKWDLDLIDKEDDWMLSILGTQAIQNLPCIEHINTNGTLVIWRKLDRLLDNEKPENASEIVNAKLDGVRRHLSLVFHRFLSGEVKGFPRISIFLNGHPITSFDPFCTKNSATQRLPEEVVRIGDAEVRLQPYILPHHSRLSASEYDFYQDRSDFISNQGAYVYRNGRLMAWGDWFRLVAKGESTKLARVQIDFPNTLDEEWTIDIKKSRAQPPRQVRDRLRQIIEKITERSVRVHRGRGEKLFQENKAPLWERYADHAGIRFAINSEHPIAATLAKKISPDDSRLLNILLEAIAASLPIEMIYSDYSTSPREIKQDEVDETKLQEHLKDIKEVIFGSTSFDPDKFRNIIISTNLFKDHIESVDFFIKEQQI